MSSKVEVPFTCGHFAAFVSEMVGEPYWYGTTGNRATLSLLKRKTAQYPSHYTSSRTAKYNKDIAAWKIVCDCIGGLKAYAWTNGGESILRALSDPKAPVNARYGANGCPDKSANGMFAYAKKKGMPWGDMDTLPNLPGVALWKEGHVGYTVDSVHAVEWRSFSYGCQRTVIRQRGWKNWYLIPFIDYGEGFSRNLSEGMAGADVKALQENLEKAGYPLEKYGADGDFGSETKAALIHFQSESGLEADGVFGEETRAALENALKSEKNDNHAAASEPEGNNKPEKYMIIRSKGGKVNIRSGNGTAFPVLEKAAPGAMFPFVAASENGWNAVKLADDVGWVSGEYSSF